MSSCSTTSPQARRAIGGPRLDQPVARILDIPFCVAGGIRTLADAEQVLSCGAEKISINSPALADPELIDALSERFGAQCVVVGIDSQTVGEDYRVSGSRAKRLEP